MNTALLDILKILTPEEFKQLRIVVRSPQYKSNLPIENLYTILRPKYPEFKLSPTALRKIYKKLFPKKSYNPKNLQKVFDALFKITETFLLKLHLEKNEFLKEKVTTLTTSERIDLFDLFKKSQQVMHDLLEEKEIKNEEYWREKVRLYDRLYSNLQHNKYDKNDDTLDHMNKATDYYYAHLKLRYTRLLKNNHGDFDNLFFEDIMNSIEAGDFSDDKLLQLYYLHANRQKGINKSEATDRGIEEGLSDAERIFISNQMV